MEIKSETYGEHLEKPVIISMSLIIVLSLVWVFWMNIHYRPDCLAAEYTYCGDTSHHPADH